MILDPTLKLEIVLTASKSTNDMDVTVDYIDWNPAGVTTPPASYRTATNGTTDVTILSAPIANPRREPIKISIYNKDTADKTVIIKTNDGTTEKVEVKKTITTLTTFIWEKATGWYSVT